MKNTFRGIGDMVIFGLQYVSIAMFIFQYALLLCVLEIGVTLTMLCSRYKILIFILIE